MRLVQWRIVIVVVPMNFEVWRTECLSTYVVIYVVRIRMLMGLYFITPAANRGYGYYKVTDI